MRWHRSHRRSAPSSARSGDTVETQPYTDHPLLRLYAFEESWVLAYGPVGDGFVFELDIAPTRSHPDWHPPPPTDWITWWRARLVFTRCQDLVVEPPGAAGSLDPSGEIDHGYIDSFLLHGDGFALEGDWGRLSMTSADVAVELLGP